MIYGDSGRFPLYINAHLRSVKYWLKLLRMDECRLPHDVYRMMLRYIDKGSNWASKVRDILVKNHFDNIWEAQCVENEQTFLIELREHLINDFSTKWELALNNSERYIFYKQIKPLQCVETYLYALDKKIFRDTYIRFRFGITDMYIHKYRYQAAPLQDICPLCNEEEEDEVHLLLRCPGLYDLRMKYIVPHVYPIDEDPISQLLASQECSTIRAVAMYLYYALRRRTVAVEAEY